MQLAVAPRANRCRATGQGHSLARGDPGTRVGLTGAPSAMGPWRVPSWLCCCEIGAIWGDLGLRKGHGLAQLAPCPVAQSEARARSRAARLSLGAGWGHRGERGENGSCVLLCPQLGGNKGQSVRGARAWGSGAVRHCHCSEGTPAAGEMQCLSCSVQLSCRSPSFSLSF